MDFANQIQLGSKGSLTSVSVPYSTESNSTLEYIDFSINVLTSTGSTGNYGNSGQSDDPKKKNFFDLKLWLLMSSKKFLSIGYDGYIIT